MKNLFIVIVLFLSTTVCCAQKVPYNVVFDITSKDTVVHEMAIRWVKEIVDNYPDAKVEVVLYGKSLDMITKDKSNVATDVMTLAKNKNVAFSVCEVAMKRNQLEKSHLLTGVGTVPDGIYEIVMKQQANWGYIKVSR